MSSVVALHVQERVSIFRMLSDRVGAYWTLTKPRIGLMVLVASAAGYLLGTSEIADLNLIRLFASCFGIVLLAVSCTLLNQLIERDTDLLMRRTHQRPTVTKAVSGAEVLLIGLITGLVAFGLLCIMANLDTAVVGFLSVVCYVGVYTLGKRLSFLSTWAGALSGAVPPALGWSAASGSFDLGACLLFFVLLLWQFPHFLAIATIHGRDYENAGLRMFPRSRRGRFRSGLVAVIYALALASVVVLFGVAGLSGPSVRMIVALAGFAYLFGSVQFLVAPGIKTARRLLRDSLIYLPLLFVLLLAERFLLSA